jgi:hypothetical protein
MGKISFNFIAIFIIFQPSNIFQKMKNTLYKKSGLIGIVVFFLAILTGCPGPTPDPNSTTNNGSGTGTVTVTFSDKIAKIWNAGSVKEDGNPVFATGGSSNTKPGYTKFKIDLSSKSSVKITEYDGNTFTGIWSISADEKTLTLSNLNPEPTGTGGTISYDINELTASILKITRNTLNRKTGANKTEYQLTNP